MLLASLLLAGWLSSLAAATTHTFDWNITWVYANPDGLAVRPVMSINDQWPLPLINITKGDRVVAKVTNGLGNVTTSVHWHGMFQNGTNFMDGPPGVTQCEIPVGGSVTYNFTVEQAGSYWYHSHTMGQYPDGLRQALIIQGPDSPYAGQYDDEVVVTVSDWYHDIFVDMLKSFISYKNPTGAEPVPKAALLNDTSDFQLSVQPGLTYLMHFINVGAFASQYIWIEGHTMRIVEVDGVWVEEAETDMIYVASAQRCSVLVTMKNDTSGENFPIVGSMDTDLFDSLPDDLNWNVTGWLVYDASASLPAAAEITEFAPYDDATLVPTDGLVAYGEPDITVTLDLTMDNLGDGANYAFFNAISYKSPVVPTLYSVISAPDSLVSNATIYGDYTNSFVLPHRAVVEIVLNNDDTGRHPFHLHGHTFQVMSRSDADAGHFNGTLVQGAAVPARRDTLVVQGGGNFAVRFVADNPGVWLFHCHIEWHMDSGLAATMIEAPAVLANQTTIPSDFLALCDADGTPTSGNAAGNEGATVEEWLDLTGQNADVPPLPAGFTTRGIVALVFSCVTGILGVAVIAWYGAAPIKPKAA